MRRVTTGGENRQLGGMPVTARSARRSGPVRPRRAAFARRTPATCYAADVEQHGTASGETQLEPAVADLCP